MSRTSSQFLSLLLAAQIACLALPVHAQPPAGNGASASVPGTPPDTMVAAPIADAGAATDTTPNVPAPAVSEAAAPKATTPPAPTLSDLGRSLRNYFTEEELGLLFQYMKESVIASFKDEEVLLPPDLSFKLEILLVRLKKEGGHYMDNLIDQLEKDLKNSVKKKLQEKLTPPPIKDQPYNPWLSKPWE
jgi:hypothetical protein